jgi:hypothetical protein
VTGYRDAWYGLLDLNSYGEARVLLRYFESKPEAMEAEYLNSFEIRDVELNHGHEYGLT